jgi:hypothetical protein
MAENPPSFTRVSRITAAAPAIATTRRAVNPLSFLSFMIGNLVNIIIISKSSDGTQAGPAARRPQLTASRIPLELRNIKAGPRRFRLDGPLNRSCA